MIAATEVVHKNASFSKMKALLRGAIPEMRFIWDCTSEQLYFANAQNFIHFDIRSEIDHYSNYRINGYVEYKNGSFNWRGFSAASSISDAQWQIFENKCEQAGLIKSAIVLDFEW